MVMWLLPWNWQHDSFPRLHTHTRNQKNKQQHELAPLAIDKQKLLRLVTSQAKEAFLTHKINTPRHLPHHCMHLAEQHSPRNNPKFKAFQFWYPHSGWTRANHEESAMEFSLHHTKELSISTVFVTFIYQAATTHPVFFVRGEWLHHSRYSRPKGFTFLTPDERYRKRLEYDWCVNEIIIPVGVSMMRFIRGTRCPYREGI